MRSMLKWLWSVLNGLKWVGLCSASNSLQLTLTAKFKPLLPCTMLQQVECREKEAAKKSW